MKNVHTQFFLKLGTSGLLAAVLVGIVTVAGYSTTPSPAKVALVTSTGTVTLDASPTLTNLTVGKEYTLSLNIHSGASHVSAAMLQLLYDPTKLTVSNFAKTSYLGIYLSNPSIATDSVTTSLGASPDSGGQVGDGTIATMTIKPLVVGQQLIAFGTDTAVATTESPENALQAADPITIAAYAPGDLNDDGKIDIFDYNTLVVGFGHPYTIFYYNDIVANYGRTYGSVTCTVRPGCLDTVPRCLPPTPAGGWCTN